MMETKRSLEIQIKSLTEDLLHVRNKLTRLNNQENPRIGKYYLLDDSTPDSISFEYIHVIKSAYDYLLADYVYITDLTVGYYDLKTYYDDQIDFMREITKEEYDNARAVIDSSIRNTIKLISPTIDRSNYCKQEEV